MRPVAANAAGMSLSHCPERAFPSPVAKAVSILSRTPLSVVIVDSYRIYQPHLHGLLSRQAAPIAGHGVANRPVDGKVCDVAKSRPKDTFGRPTRAQLEAAVHRSLRDLVAPDLKILFCGINPGRYSTAAGHHFAGPNNRFWPTLYAAGFTPRLLRPSEDAELLPLGYGITNLVPRTTATADLLTRQELLEGARCLHRKVRRLKPAILAVVGLGAYRTAFNRPAAACGLQDHVVEATRVWLLPNPSGLNAHHQGPALVALFRALRLFSGAVQPST